MSNFLHTSVAIETVESTTEQLQIGNNSVDMVDESNLVSSSVMLVALIEWLLYVRGSFAILQISLIVFAKVFFPSAALQYQKLYILNLCYSNICYYFSGNPLCPVSSFKKYLSKLHPSKNDLWQKPRDSFEEDSFWYCNAALHFQ
jgi:hypothetical protein